MLTSPGPDANRGDHSQTGLVVRLSVPGTPADARRGAREVTGDGQGPRAQHQPGPDLRGIARAVEDLVHAVAPDVITSVEIELREPGRPAGLGQGGPKPAGTNGAVVGRRWAPLDDEAGKRPLAPVPAESPRDPAEPFDVDTTRRTLALDGDPVELTRREFDLLAFLERHRGQALGRDELMRAVWHTGYISGDRTIDVHVRRLRVKLGRHADRLVTLRGYGYRLD
ncbi:winged helix-turn-helix transcriptional regulator [Kineosporia sp. J2-2]|uniref:Winged helix-turn-helix transcriptional regulator n=1 Tax=Kineosporia corallincola TaxID=2835133 RepID=A0ABS5TFC6_9ACTN|nr:winged helix-turn-helix domain-containing protein [Kineosporia corallincola]MBT0769785.1 winged helix-turn-helix transcriptional regulator [Kineosporia corallincola]